MADKCEKKICRNKGCGNQFDTVPCDYSRTCRLFSPTSTQSIIVERLKALERKEKAFDWFIKEMMDEELEGLMEKGNYKTPLEAIEKAMMEQGKGVADG